MRILLFSDIHGNVLALDAVLKDRHRHGPYDLTIVAGDLVWAGPRPMEVMARLRELCDGDPGGVGGVVSLLGNTDQFLLADFGHRPPANKRHRRFARHREWMLDQLKPKDLIFLQEMPFSYRVRPVPAQGPASKDQDLLVVHANPRNLDDPIYEAMTSEQIGTVVGEVDFQVLAFGHIHTPFVKPWRGRLLVDVASVGLPQDGDARAAYSVLTWERGSWSAEQYRVAYNAERVAQDMQDCGLPRGKHFARRLLAARYT